MARWLVVVACDADSAEDAVDWYETPGLANAKAISAPANPRDPEPGFAEALVAAAQKALTDSE